MKSILKSIVERIVIQINKSPSLWVLIRVEAAIVLFSMIPWGISGGNRYQGPTVDKKPLVLRVFPGLNYFEMFILQFIFVNLLVGVIYYFLSRHKKKKRD